MLRISTVTASARAITLLLDGQLKGRWVELLRKSCQGALDQGVRLTLDLKNVSYIDREGIALLASLRAREVGIVNTPPFVTEQIRGTAT